MATLRTVFGHRLKGAGQRVLEPDLFKMRRKVRNLPVGSKVTLGPYVVRINDGLNSYVMYKDIFVKRIYHFTSASPAPYVLDLGSNIGMSILYFKNIYPGCRILGFEPDPLIFPFLQENVAVNRLNDVDVRQVAVGGEDGLLDFYSDAKYGSFLSRHPPVEANWKLHRVRGERLSVYLDQSVDFMKMNIEGAEWAALAEAGDRLRVVDQMVIEYHHLPSLPRTLHKILGLLNDLDFEYLISDFDEETNPVSVPPFELGPDSRYFLLIYARRRK